jgi:hypothetical protein
MAKRSICTSQPFAYRYKNKIRESYVVLYLDGDHLRYRVTLGNDQWIIIIPSTFPGSEHSVVWTQATEPGEMIQPNELIQALGNGIEAMTV